VDADNLCAALYSQSVGRNSGREPVIHRGAACHFAQEALARTAKKEWVAQFLKLIEAGDEGGVLGRRFAESDTGINDAVPAGNAVEAGPFKSCR